MSGQVELESGLEARDGSKSDRLQRGYSAGSPFDSVV